jgi:hypothetical protein
MTAAAGDIPDSPPPNITARVLAPLALAACVLALFLLVSGTLSDEEAGSGEGGGRDRVRTEQTQNRPDITGDTYVVQPGDTLSAIAVKAGIPLARLERRNPDIDPAALNAGQQIRLR